MVEKKFNYKVLYKEIEKHQNQDEFLSSPEGLKELDEIDELCRIVASIQEPKINYLTTT